MVYITKKVRCKLKSGLHSNYAAETRLKKQKQQPLSKRSLCKTARDVIKQLYDYLDKAEITSHRYNSIEKKGTKDF